MKKKIETIEQLDSLLANPYFDISRHEGETEMEVLAWHLVTHNPFDTALLYKGTREREDAPDYRRDDFCERSTAVFGPSLRLDNKQLREWITATPLENVAAYTAYIVRKMELDKVSNYWDAAQDHYADHWTEWQDYERGKTKGRDFVNSVISQVEEVENHASEGKALGLSMDEIVLHDALWGLLPCAFDPELVPIARDVLQEAQHRLPDRPYIWSEAGKKSYAPMMLKYAAEKMDAAGYDIGYPNAYTIEQGYLLDYFSRLYWREAATKPEF